MSIKWSPGCKCCGTTGCESNPIGYTPTSQLSRGEWDGTQYWSPVTLYTANERFLQARVSDGRLCAWESPVEQQSGPGWSEQEESRYDIVSVIDKIDQVTEWEIFGDGWNTLTEVQVEQALANGYLFQDCGFISKADVLPTTTGNWSVSFSFSYPNRFDQSVFDYVLDGNRLAFGLYAAVTSKEAFLDAVRIRYEGKPLAESPTIDISVPNCQGYKRQAQWNIKLFSGQSLLDETWRSLASEPLIARTSQPVGGNIVDVIEVGATPVSLFSKLSPQSMPYSALLVVGDGEVYAGNDPSDPSQRLAVEDGDIVIAERLHISTGIDAFRLVKNVDVVTEPIVFGGGMRVYAPPDMAAGRKVAIFCSIVDGVNPSMFNGLTGVGLSFAGAFAIKARQIDEPTCRVIVPNACPCPGDAEWYPVTITEGLNKDFAAIDTILAEFVQGVDIGVAGETIIDEELGALQYSMLRNSMCSFTFLKLKAWNRVKFRRLVSPAVDLYTQVVTFGYEDGRLDLIPVFNRMLRVKASATIGIYNLTESGSGGTPTAVWTFAVPYDQPPPLLTFDEIVGNVPSQRDPPFPFIANPYPCEFYLVMQGRWAFNGRGYGTGAAFHYASGEVIQDIPHEDFTCSDYVIAGSYDKDRIPDWWNPLLGPSPDNVLLGLPWTITM